MIDLLFTYQGRINRAKFWLTVLIFTVILSIDLALFFVLPTVAFFIGIILYLVMIVSGVMVGIKRLHDLDMTAWWLVLFYAVPMVASWGGMHVGGLVSSAVSLIGSIVSLWGLVVLGAMRGTIGPNQHGPDPVAPA